METKEQLIQQIRKYIIKDYQDPLISYIRPSIQLKTERGSVENPLSSKLGGLPYIKTDTSWPRSSYDNKAFSFLGQIYLAELVPFDEEGLLPKSGMLYFFFDLNAADDGKVIYDPHPKDFEIPASS